MKVTAIHGQPESDQHGNVSAFISVEGQDKNVLLRKKPPFPQVGEDLPGYEVVEKTAQSGKTYLKAEKPQQATFNRGGGKDYKADPVKQAAISMQACHNTAIEYARFLLERDKLPQDFGLQQLAQIADFFYTRVTAAGEKAS